MKISSELKMAEDGRILQEFNNKPCISLFSPFLIAYLIIRLKATEVRIARFE